MHLEINLPLGGSPSDFSFKNRPWRQAPSTEPFSQPRSGRGSSAYQHSTRHSAHSGKEPGQKMRIVLEVLGVEVLGVEVLGVERAT